jgi:hypothetical protein
MRVVEHLADGPHKLLRIETEGCAVHIVIGLHGPQGQRFTTVEVEPAQPADDGHVWQVCGPATVVVVDAGPQVLASDRDAGQHNGAKSAKSIAPVGSTARLADRGGGTGELPLEV